MDLADVLDVTHPVECEFLDHKVVAHVYTSRSSRLTKEERTLLTSLDDNRINLTPDELKALPDDERHSKERQSYDVGIDAIRTALPVLCAGIDLDGDPLTYKGQAFPENVALYPDQLLVALGNPILDFWNNANPTNGDQPQTGSQPEEIPDSNQTVNTTHLAM